MAKKAWILLANGFEEIEAVTPTDVLRRAGVEVTLLGVGGKSLAGAHGLVVQADAVLETTVAEEFTAGKTVVDALILPGGGPGADNLAASELVLALVRHQVNVGRLTAAICASPAVVLGRAANVLNGKQATCYPGCEGFFSKGTVFKTDRVVRDGNILTSRGPGTAMEFSLELVRILIGDETADKLVGQMIVTLPV